jgi:mRNA interferase RelE/StbE
MRARENPFNFFEKLTDRDDFRMRVGDYRIIADIDTNNNTIYIRLIGHRRNIYER